MSTSRSTGRTIPRGVAVIGHLLIAGLAVAVGVQATDLPTRALSVVAAVAAIVSIFWTRSTQPAGRRRRR